MSHIKTSDDVDYILGDYKTTGKITEEQSILLKTIVFKIITHKQLQAYFNSELTIYNEQDIITKDGHLLRPDRIVINSNNDAVIIDYKTGLYNSKHQEQLHDYQSVLEDMNFKVIKKILIYINDEITIKEF